MLKSLLNISSHAWEVMNVTEGAVVVPPGGVPGWIHGVVLGVLSLLLVIILTSSSAVLLVVCANSRLHTVPGYLMVALGVCDIALALTSILPSAVSLAVGEWVFGRPLCYAQAFCTTYFGSVESTFIMLCAVDRFSAIQSPLRYSGWEIQVMRFLRLIFAGVIVVNLPASLMAILMAKSANYTPMLNQCAFKFAESNWLPPLLNYIYQSAACVVIVICYSFIAYAAIRSKLRDNNTPSFHAASNGGGGQHGSTLLQHLKVCKMLFIISIMYFLSFIPLFVYSFLVKFDVAHFSIYVFVVFHLLTYCNGAINGVVFYSMSVVFQQCANRTLSNLVPRALAESGGLSCLEREPSLLDDGPVSRPASRKSTNFTQKSSHEMTTVA